ncbi:MAG TPA: hypothetical protein VF179_32800 [Thermoanaerobaculia bacterium]|nr:hypothetical protein [Thermoanaerobaculia bacterium]
MPTNTPSSSLPPLSQEQLDRIVQALRSQYPRWESFDDPRFIADEVTYKKEAITKAAELLSTPELRQLLAERRFDEIVKRVEHIGRTNLLYHRVPMSGDLGILYQPNLDEAGFCAALVDLLHGEGESPDRLGRYLAWVEDAGLPNRWTFPTYFLFMCHPETEIFIKPGATAGFLDLLGFQEELRGPSPAWYAMIRSLAHQLRDALADRGAKDMVDIQSAIFIAGWKGGTRYWKVAPERGAVLWDKWRDDGYISIGWEKIGDISKLSREEFETQRRAIEREDKEYTAQGARQVWDFAHIREGDQIVANRGHKEVLGIGTVTGPYMFLPGIEHGHRISVQWTDLRSRTVNQRSWNNTLRSLTRKKFQEILDSPVVDPVDPPTPPSRLSFEDLRTSLRSTGLYFPAEVVSNYLLALQTKRFVIITGISGTGKTQLALEVARYFQPRVRTAKTVDIPDGAREVTVAPYMIKYNRIVLPAAFVGILSLPTPEPETNKSSIDVVYPEGRTRLSLWRSADRDVVILLFKGELRSWFGRSLKVGDKIYLAAEEPEDGPSIIHLGIPRTVIEEATVENYVVEAVRPDWTDHRGLLGYFNPLTGRYVSTPFLDLVLRAKEEEDKARDEVRNPHPFFAILDEMNLARVEHYFSDFLSALESGEPLRLHDEMSVESGETEDAVPIPRSLGVPRNLFFTGTVNVDESTYMFSPKVLDRAFALELNEVNLDGLSNLDSLEGDEPGLRVDRFPEWLTFEGSPNSKHWDNLGAEPKRIVKDLNGLLAQENRHFGYRVAAEISRFVTLAAEQATGEGAQRAALDLALLQKVLPKLHGTQQELEDLLKKLVHFGSGAALPRFTAKVERMLRRLERQGFTSFIE